MRHKEATQLHTHRRSHSGNSSAASRHTHPSISDAFIKLRLPLPLPHPQPQPRLVDDICGTMATLLQGAGTSCSDYCLPLEAATGGTGGQELVVELAGWDTRLGARRKFKLSAGSKRFALISTKMQRSPSLSSLSLYLSLAIAISASVPKAHTSFSWVVFFLLSLSLTSFRQSQIIHFAASKCINILPVEILLSPSYFSFFFFSLRLFCCP